MGNCSCSSKSRNALNCFGNKHAKKSKQTKNKTSDVLPEDLHASSGQECQPGARSSVTQRPSSLEVQAETHGEPSSKFPAFSLHGIQKSSPTTAGGNEPPVNASPKDKVNVAKVEKLFKSYRDSTADVVLAEGVERFCLDLEVDPTEFIVLALAWKFKAETMCKFTRKEFIDGFVELGCDSIKGLQSTFKQIESEAVENFKDLYRYTFQFALDPEQGQRSLPCSIAAAMWDVVFSRNPPKLLQPWLAFLQENKVRGISRDTWNMFLYLTECLNDDLSNYNDNEAWPSLFDDFVDYQREIIKEMKVEAASSGFDEKPSPSQDPSHSPQEKNIDSSASDGTATDIPGTILPSAEDLDSKPPVDEVPDSTLEIEKLTPAVKISETTPLAVETQKSSSPADKTPELTPPITQAPGVVPPSPEDTGSIPVLSDMPASSPPSSEVPGSIPPSERPKSNQTSNETPQSLEKSSEEEAEGAGDFSVEHLQDENEDLLQQLHAERLNP